MRAKRVFLAATAAFVTGAGLIAPLTSPVQAAPVEPAYDVAEGATPLVVRLQPTVPGTTQPLEGTATGDAVSPTDGLLKVNVNLDDVAGNCATSTGAEGKIRIVDVDENTTDTGSVESFRLTTGGEVSISGTLADGEFVGLPFTITGSPAALTRSGCGLGSGKAAEWSVAEWVLTRGNEPQPKTIRCSGGYADAIVTHSSPSQTQAVEATQTQTESLFQSRGDAAPEQAVGDCEEGAFDDNPFTLESYNFELNNAREVTSTCSRVIQVNDPTGGVVIVREQPIYDENGNLIGLFPEIQEPQGFVGTVTVTNLTGTNGLPTFRYLAEGVTGDFDVRYEFTADRAIPLPFCPTPDTPSSTQRGSTLNKATLVLTERL